MFGNRRGGREDSTSGRLWISSRRKEKKQKKTSRPRTALKGETKTVIDVEKDVGRQLLDRLHLVKVHKLADKPQCKPRVNQPKE